MRQLFILITICRYLFRFIMTVLKIIFQSSATQTNNIGGVNLVADSVAFAHNLIVFIILMYELRGFHRREYRLKRNGLCIYFSVLWLNFIVCALGQSFMTFCIDSRFDNQADRIEICQAQGMDRGQYFYVTIYLITWL